MMKRLEAIIVTRVVGVLAGLIAAAAFVPTVMWAQATVAEAAMYEVLTALQFKQPIKHSNPPAFAKRFADAALLGNHVISFGDPVFGASSYIGVTTTSNININPASQNFGTGPIQRQFELLADFNGGNVDHLSDLVVVARGNLVGTVDLRPALDPTNPLPSAPVSGQWGLKGDRRKGVFQGAFLSAADLSPVGLSGDWYIQPDSLNVPCVSGIIVALPPGAVTPGAVNMCQLHSTEYVLGIPLTKAFIVLSR